MRVGTGLLFPPWWTDVLAGSVVTRPCTLPRPRAPSHRSCLAPSCPVKGAGRLCFCPRASEQLFSTFKKFPCFALSFESLYNTASKLSLSFMLMSRRQQQKMADGRNASPEAWTVCALTDLLAHFIARMKSCAEIEFLQDAYGRVGSCTTSIIGGTYCRLQNSRF